MSRNSSKYIKGRIRGGKGVGIVPVISGEEKEGRE